MNEMDLFRLSEKFDEGVNLSDFTTEELEEMLNALNTSQEAFKRKYFEFYDDVKHSSLKKQDW